MNNQVSQVHCCESMHYWANYRCVQHSDPAECPDNIVSYSATHGVYGIRIHDGGASYIEIKHCPWCGAHLSPNKALQGMRRKQCVPER